MDFQPLIDEYKESDSTGSPIWIWFEKNGSAAKCKICSQTVPRKDSSTTGMVHHLKAHHGLLRKVNAWKTYEELSELKEKRVKEKTKKRKNDEPDTQPKKQPKLMSSLNPKYARDDKRQIDRNNALGSMICVDATPANMIGRPGMKHAIET